MTTLIYTEQLTVVHCTCGIPFAIPTELNERALDNRGPNGVRIHCPVGHSWWYTGKTDAQKLADVLEQERQRVARLTHQRDQAQAAADHEQARANGYKGALAKVKRRVAAGVCPCCNRSFQDLARHMRGQHPDYAS